MHARSFEEVRHRRDAGSTQASSGEDGEDAGLLDDAINLEDTSSLRLIFSGHPKAARAFRAFQIFGAVCLCPCVGACGCIRKSHSYQSDIGDTEQVLRSCGTEASLRLQRLNLIVE
mmetsp:Transcript_77797/g.222947  ORF Transcript_77797/g.222947 Transcript_77797/m.222947 type:complete len:116 (+) Transcript_77797:81-428(+)